MQVNFTLHPEILGYVRIVFQNSMPFEIDEIRARDLNKIDLKF